MGIPPVVELASWEQPFVGLGAGSGPLSGPWYSAHKEQPCDAEAYGDCKALTMMSARFGGNSSTSGDRDLWQSKCYLLGHGFFILAETQLVGVLLAAASNFLISVSLNIQKCAHLRLLCEAELKPCYSSKLWWCGTALLGLGELGHSAAYGFAPIALVATLGCVSVVVEVFLCVVAMMQALHLFRVLNSLRRQQLFSSRGEIGSAFISVLFLKRTMRAADILGGALTVTGTYLLVMFAPDVPQELTAKQVQSYLVSWPFVAYSILEIITFCILLYFYKRKAVKHIVVLLTMVALLASPTAICVKAVASMMTLSAKGKMQLTYPVFYIMIVLMAISCAFQVKFLDQAMHLYKATTVVPINFVFSTTSAIVSGVVFYREFHSAALLSVFMFLFGCLLSFLGLFVIARDQKEEQLQTPFVDCGHIPGQKVTGKIQPDSHSTCYGTLNNEDNSSVKSQS